MEIEQSIHGKKYTVIRQNAPGSVSCRITAHEGKKLIKKVFDTNNLITYNFIEK